MDKELFDPLPDVKDKVQSSFMVSLGMAERAEFHTKVATETFPWDLSLEYSSTVDRHKKSLFTLNGGLNISKEKLRTTGVFHHPGGRLVLPNTGKPQSKQIKAQALSVRRKSAALVILSEANEKQLTLCTYFP